MVIYIGIVLMCVDGDLNRIHVIYYLLPLCCLIVLVFYVVSCRLLFSLLVFFSSFDHNGNNKITELRTISQNRNGSVGMGKSKLIII